MKYPEAIMFDLDGVLIDTETIHEKIWVATTSLFNYRLTQNQLEDLKGRRRVDCINAILNMIEKPITQEEFSKAHQNILKKFTREIKPIEGARSLVDYCVRKSIKIALVTSSSKDSFETKRSSQKWLNIFKIIVKGDDPLIKNGKPFPDPYLIASKKLNVNPYNCWIVEDSIAGAQSGLAAGSKVWLIRNEEDITLEGKLDTNNNKLSISSNLKSIENHLKSLN